MGWNDFEHCLKPKNSLDIIELSEKIVRRLWNRVEYQAKTIGKYDLSFNGKDFTLLNKPQQETNVV
jgi:hypothetical protein